MSLSTKFLGIEIGGTKLQLCVANLSGGIEHNLRYAINPEGGAASIQNQIGEGLKKLDSYKNVVAIGVGFGGPVDWKTGSVCISHQVSGWDAFHLSTWLKDLTQKPVVVENDANVAALAEVTYGCGKGYERVFYI